MNRVLKFSDYFLNEDATQKEINEIPGVTRLPDDGYEICAYDFTEDSDDLPVGKILVVKDNGKSICLAYSDYKGRLKSQIWIPKDSVKITKDEDSNFIINMNPYKGFLNRQENSDMIEDFIEDYYDNVVDDDGDSDLSDRVKDDIISILDMLGIECEVSDVRKLEGDNEYEADLSNKMMVGIKKRSRNDLVGNFDIYRDKSQYAPSLTMNSSNGKINFGFDKDVLPKENIECSLGEATKDNYINYLMKKSLGVDNHEDRGRMYDHFVKNVESMDFNDLKSEDEKKKEKAHDALKSIKTMRRLVSDFIPDEKIREILPNHLTN
jgi:hypothetical protein